MKKINLTDGTKIHCLKETEALVLDEHISGYLEIGIDISEKDTIIDVGANIGVFGVRLSQKFQNISIYSFEPIPEIYKSLKKNAELSLNPNFKTYMMGLSNKKQILDFTYYPNSPALSTSHPEVWQNDKNHFNSAVEGSILTMGSQFWWSKLIPKVFIPFIAKYLQANQQKISSQVITLSDFVEKEKIQKIKLLKIDCEGEEINVLYGIQKNHWEKIESIVMEINDINHNLKMAKSILSKNGFQKIKLVKEKGFEKTKLINLYATK